MCYFITAGNYQSKLLARRLTLSSILDLTRSKTSRWSLYFSSLEVQSWGFTIAVMSCIRTKWNKNPIKAHLKEKMWQHENLPCFTFPSILSTYFFLLLLLSFSLFSVLLFSCWIFQGRWRVPPSLKCILVILGYVSFGPFQLFIPCHTHTRLMTWMLKMV